MKALLILFFAAYLSAFNPAYAQSGCAQINEVIDEAIFSAALSYAAGELQDKSAAQQTSTYVNMNNRLQVIGINISLLAQNRCPPRSKPINPMRYVSQAGACYAARVVKEADAASKCDFKSWRFE